MNKILVSTNSSGELLRQIIRNLKQAEEYCFASAYFDLTVIKEYFDTLKMAIENKTKVKFLISNQIDTHVFEAIKSANEGKLNNFFDLKALSFFDNSQKKLLFNWMKNEDIEFRIAANYRGGIFHFKLGYIKKRDGTIFSWSGSANHTYNAFSGKNDEHLSFFQSDEDDKNLKIFIEAWKGKINKTLIFKINDIMISELSVLQDEFNPIEFLKNKWKKLIFYDGDKLHYTTQKKEPLYFAPSIGPWEGNEGHYYIEKSFNKLKLLDWIENNDEVYVPSQTLMYLNDNISKMEKIVEEGLSIKNDWSRVSKTKKFDKFKEIFNGLNRTPFDLQYRQSYFSYVMGKSLNFSVPGTGKTMVSLMTFLALKKFKSVERIFVIGPTASHQEWIDEYTEIFNEAPIVLNLSSLKNKTADEKWKIISEISWKKYDLIIMHFATATKYYHIIKHILTDKDFFIIDEAHYIKNIFGEWGQAMTKLGLKSKFSLLLTGTPAANGIVDINNLMSITFGESFLNFFNTSNDKERLISALSMRITFNDLNLKYKQVNNRVQYPLSSHQIEYIAELNSALFKNYNTSFLEVYIKKMQALSSLNLLNGMKYSVDSSPKLKRLLGLVEPGKNIVIWCYFILSVESIKDAIHKLNPDIDVYTYFGKSDPNERVESINGYKKTGGVLIANPQTLAEAVSLHKHTDYTIFYEYSFNLIHWLQSRNRTFRYGIKNDMHYHILSTNDDVVDSYILKRLEEKQTFQENIMSYSEDNIIEDTIGDIKRFIEGLKI